MLSPIKTVIIITSTIAPMDNNIVYKLPKDYSYEANKVIMQKSGFNSWGSDILYKQIYKENRSKSE